VRETEPGHALLPGRARQMHVTAAKVGMMLSCTRLLPAVRLAAAATLVVVALFGTDLLLRGVHQPTFLLLIPIIILTAAMWGAAIGVTAAALSIAGMALLLEPRWSLSVVEPGERVLLAVFGAVAVVSVLVANHYYRFREAMRVNEAEFRALFELAAVGCAMVDHTTGRILRANAQFSTITGFTLDELLSMTIAEITHPEDRERDRVTLSELSAGVRNHWTTEKRYIRKDGSVVWVLVNGALVRDSRGRPDHAIAHAVDISSRRDAEQEAREANRLKDEFLATLSHELRTPLNVVAGWVRLLGNTPSTQSSDMRRGWPVLERNVDALRRLTDDLLGMSDVLAGRIFVQRQPVLIDRLLSEIADSLEIPAQSKRLVINTQFGSGAVVQGDESRLRQVFWNIVSNALKFTPQDGAVNLSTVFDGTHVVVEIADTGIGIAPSFLPHVFDKFRQEDGTHTREHSGLGLGLAIARQFVDLHGGTITAASPGRGGGSSFVVRIPAAQAPAVQSSTRNATPIRIIH
jgi:two-component system CheB/CheR fusion protein